jgi:CRP/FNR family cyclic AMP-dependent transcriptional regulator
LSNVKDESVSIGRLVTILGKIPLFAGLGREEYQRLLRVCRVTRHRAGDQIFAQGDVGAEMFVVLSGTVEVFSEEAGALTTMSSGAVLGEIALVNRVRRTAGARATSDAALLRIARHDLDSLVGTAPRISYLVMRHTAEVLAERLVDATRSTGRYALDGG